MALHLVKMAVGAGSIEDIAAFQKARRAKLKAERGKPMLIHRTRNMPKRDEEILDGGSIYWIVKGFIRVRQRILGFERVTGRDGRPDCEIRLAIQLFRTVPVAHKPIQGWRYMEAAAAPLDLPARAKRGEDMPPEMMMKLRELGLL
jgi:hypothetical protein